MTVLVTGASGFVGTHLCKHLIKNKRKVVALIHDRLVWNPWQKDALDNCVLVTGDIRDFHFLKRVLNQYNINVVIHLAAQSIVKRAWKDPVNTFDINVMGTIKLLEACHQLKVEKIIIQSTDKVYGAQMLASNQDKLYPTEPYGTSKICFTPRMKVLTEQGLQPINQIKADQKVWTHHGRLRNVTKILRRPYEGEILTIRIASQRNRLIENVQITCTPNHPILTKHGWKKASELAPEDKVAVIRAKCEQCGKTIPFYKTFCSRRCEIEYKVTNGIMSRGRKKTQFHYITCLNCGKEFVLTGAQFRRRKGKFCSQKCSHEFRREHKIDSDRHGEWYKGYRGWNWQTVRKYVLERDNHTCQLCGKHYLQKPSFLIVHHIKPYHFFATVEEANNPKNLITLCRSCHSSNVLKKLLNNGKLHFTYAPIKWIHKRKYSRRFSPFDKRKYPKYVYNLEVAEDQSYIVHGIAVHNCVDVAAQTFIKTYEMNINILRSCNIYGYDWNNRIIPNTIRSCFFPNTAVLTEDGYRPIHSIEVGDRVCTHKMRLKKVTKIFKRYYDGEMYQLDLGHHAGWHIRIKATPEHPFLTNKGWVPLCQLKKGDMLKVIARNKCEYCGEDLQIWLRFCSRSCSMKHVHNIPGYWKHVIKKTLQKRGKNHHEYYLNLLIKKVAPQKFEFTGDGKLLLGLRCPDWTSDSLKKIIEYRGRPRNPDTNSLSEDELIEYYMKYGYETLMLHADDFKKPKLAIKKIRDFAKEPSIITPIKHRKEREYKAKKLEKYYIPKIWTKTNYEDGLITTNIPITQVRKCNHTAHSTIHNLEVEEDNSYIVKEIPVHNCLKDKSPVIFKNESSQRQYIYIKDVVEVLDELGVRGEPGVYNLGNPNDILGQEQVVLKILKFFPDLKPRYIEKPQLKEIHSQSLITDFDRSYVSFDEGIKRTIEAYRRYGID